MFSFRIGWNGCEKIRVFRGVKTLILFFSTFDVSMNLLRRFETVPCIRVYYR